MNFKFIYGLAALLLLNLVLYSKPLPKELRPPWQKKARIEAYSLLDKLNEALNDKKRKWYLLDNQGNQAFYNENAELIADRPDTPFERPVSAKNIEYYFNRSMHLYKIKKYKQADKIFREIFFLNLNKNSFYYPRVEVFKTKLTVFLNNLASKYDIAKNIYRNYNPVFTEDTVKKQFTVYAPLAYLRGSIPSNNTIKAARYIPGEKKDTSFFIFDSRSDLTMELLNWKYKKQDIIDQYNAQNILDNITKKIDLKTEVPKFKFHIISVQNRWNINPPVFLQDIKSLWIKKRGIMCNKGCIYNGKNINIVRTNPVLAGALQIEYNYFKPYRNELKKIMVTDIFLIKGHYSYIFTLEAFSENLKEGQTAYYNYLLSLEITPPLLTRKVDP